MSRAQAQPQGGDDQHDQADVDVDGARERLTLLIEQTKAHLDAFGPRAEILRSSVDFVLERRN